MNPAHTAALLVYNASAGSGKTFSLVRAYLTRLLGSSDPYQFRSMLALTFTNKAVAEMKQRILQTLFDLAKDPETCKMLNDLEQATGLGKDQLQAKAQQYARLLLNEYASFGVETIDSFNHRVIRTFARDLKIGQHTEISLETDRYLDEAVDRVIHKAGKDPAITQLLLDFTFFKMERGNSWNINYDLREAAPDMLKEVEQPHLELLKDKSIADFTVLSKSLQDRNQSLKQQIRQTALAIQKSILDTGADPNHLTKNFVNPLNKFIEGTFDHKSFSKTFTNALTIDPSGVYNNGLDPGSKSAIDALFGQFEKQHELLHKKTLELERNKNILKQLPPTATLHLVREALEEVKSERDLMFISDFNLLIGDHIKTQPAPFIYERLGERYRHYFIDEFQDTSGMQWSNLIPLVENSLLQLDVNDQAGSLLVVGDAKQAIYRWRGGEAQQFVDLYQKRSPFSLAQEQIRVIPLRSNWRSAPQIVDFNNRFFQYVSTQLDHPDYAELYKEGNKQIAEGASEGYVSLSFVNGENAEERQQAYVEAVMDRINRLQGQGFALQDICILTRKLKHGTLLAGHLLEAGIPVVSEETLLLKNAPLIKGLVGCLRLLSAPENPQYRLETLLFLHEHFELSSDKHDFLCKALKAPLAQWNTMLPTRGGGFDLTLVATAPLLDTVEFLLGSLDIKDQADPTIPAFLDLLLGFIKQGNPTMAGFLDYWELKKDKASAKGMGVLQGVRIMTIHKAKGLEFPAVIVPFVESNTDPMRWDTSWYPLNDYGFEEARISYAKQTAQYGTAGKALYEHTQTQVQLDMVNLLYVALTRPEQELHILSSNTAKGRPGDSCPGLLRSYLESEGLWEEGKTSYDWGKAVCNKKTASKTTTDFRVPYRVSDQKLSAARFVIRPATEARSITEAQAFGTLLHEAMAQIQSKEDLSIALQTLKERNLHSPQLLSAIQIRVSNIVEHPELSYFFNEKDKIYNEQELVTPDAFLIPDRFQVDPQNNTTLIDYKTGQPSESHVLQIQSYKIALEAMGHKVVNMLLVYCSEPQIVVNKV